MSTRRLPSLTCHCLFLLACPFDFETWPCLTESDISHTFSCLKRAGDAMEDKIQKEDQVWKKQLTPNQYYVTRQKGTEPPFTGEYEDTEAPGMYKCVCCGQPLFHSETKFHSSSGWPSFYAPAGEQAVETESDASHGMQRT